ncbi:hypothetical protein NDU88_001771 [Pleurodeles waltl]|uniref:Uncharacterized protein n=1 Tax=Pleurodeles waltl TaxID=8319 RepID=A0AAV7TIR2_PLEWA|nr:hypothetical protein NDU88_001771 [Pleurodeles waltl]
MDDTPLTTKKGLRRRGSLLVFPEAGNNLLSDAADAWSEEPWISTKEKTSKGNSCGHASPPRPSSPEVSARMRRVPQKSETGELNVLKSVRLSQRSANKRSLLKPPAIGNGNTVRQFKT